MTPSVDPAAFRRWMGQFATGVTIVTAQEDERSFGLTVNAFLSVSLEPPLVLVSLSADSDTTPVVGRTGRFAVSILAVNQRALSQRFADTASPAEKFSGVRLRRSPGGLPWIEGALGALECTVEDSRPVADHVLFVGRVIHLDAGEEGDPLLFFRGRYVGPPGSQLQPVPPEKP